MAAGGHRGIHKMKHLLLISAMAKKSLMGSGPFFGVPCLGLLKVAALTPSGWRVTAT